MLANETVTDNKTAARPSQKNFERIRMRMSGQVLAVGGVILIGSSAMMSSDASAFGQQWRPAAAYPASQAFADRRVTSHRIANVPSFRPRSVSRDRHYSATPTLNRYRAAQRFANVAPARHAYRMPSPVPVAQPVNNYAVAQGWPGMMWSNPFTQMVRAWQAPMPMPSRQFAWRPAEQPWRARQSVSYSWPYQPERPMAAVQYGQQRIHASPSGNRFAQNPYAHNRWGGQVWRPANRVVSQRAYPNDPRLVAARSPTVQTFVHAPQRPPVGAVNNPRGHWRPAGAAVAAAYPADRGFRPATYGKSRLAAAEAQPSARSQSQKLPGWVTTYQEPGGMLDGCYWCSGS